MPVQWRICAPVVGRFLIKRQNFNRMIQEFSDIADCGKVMFVALASAA